jgi:hypothetical protein
VLRPQAAHGSARPTTAGPASSRMQQQQQQPEGARWRPMSSSPTRRPGAD